MAPVIAGQSQSPNARTHVRGPLSVSVCLREIDPLPAMRHCLYTCIITSQYTVMPVVTLRSIGLSVCSVTVADEQSLLLFPVPVFSNLHWQIRHSSGSRAKVVMVPQHCKRNRLFQDVYRAHSVRIVVSSILRVSLVVFFVSDPVLFQRGIASGAGPRRVDLTYIFQA